MGNKSCSEPLCIKWIPSPNYGRSIRYIVIHGTGKKTLIDVVEHFKNPKSEVSSHYLIGSKGECFQFVKEEDVAWHAGISEWNGDKSLNYTSIGIELFNPSAGNEHPYTASQYETLVSLLQRLMKKYNIPLSNVIGHDDIAPNRRTDPGIYFDWGYIRERLRPKKLAEEKPCLHE